MTKTLKTWLHAILAWATTEAPEGGALYWALRAERM
jgi:hypothetical protein